jgi:hypothetical protein
MGGKPSEPPKPEELRTKAVLARSAALRAHFPFLTAAGFAARRAFLLAPETGALRAKAAKRDMTEAMLTNPDVMSGMVKQQLGGLGPQLAMGAFVQFFYRGFVLGRLPFGLAPKFRAMLQSGIDLPALDPSYLSSLSYYMLLLFGSRGVMTLFFQDAAVNDAAMMMQMQGGGGGGGMMNPAAMDPEKAMAAEAKALEAAAWRSRLEGAEGRAAAVLRARLGRRPA